MSDTKAKQDAFYRVNLDWQGTITKADGKVVKVGAPDKKLVESANKQRK